MQSNDDLIRIFSTIQLLLAEGVFPGKLAPSITDCFEYADRFIKKLEQDSGQEAGTDGSSVGNAPDAAGVASDPVQPSGRKGRGRKGK